MSFSLSVKHLVPTQRLNLPLGPSTELDALPLQTSSFGMKLLREGTPCFFTIPMGRVTSLTVAPLMVLSLTENGSAVNRIRASLCLTVSEGGPWCGLVDQVLLPLF